MSKLVYGRPDEQISALATVTVETGTTDANFLPANLIDLDPGNPAKFTGTTGVAWLFDFGVAKSIEMFMACHHNWTAGLNVRLQGNAANAWGAPTLDQPLTIPAYHEDGFPVNPWLDLTGVSHNFRYWRLVTVGANANPVAVGETLFYTTKRTLEINYSWGADIGEDHPVIDLPTQRGANLVYWLGTKQRQILGEVEAKDNGLASLKSLERACYGRARGFMAVKDGAVNDAMFVRLLSSYVKYKEDFTNHSVYPFQVEEISRGTVLS